MQFSSKLFSRGKRLNRESGLVGALKKVVRKIFVPTFFSGYPKIVISSSGRSGSTLLYDTVAESIVRRKFGTERDSVLSKVARDLISGYVDRLDSLKDSEYLVCKTHDLCEAPLQNEARYIFVYGDPLESALSVRSVVELEGKVWFREHQAHLRADGAFEDLFQKDVLNYRGQLQSWLKRREHNLLCIDFDDVWREECSISQFLGLDLRLPARRSRAHKPKDVNVNNRLFSELRELKDTLKQEYITCTTGTDRQ